MGSITIKVGASGKTSRVSCVPVVKGLAAHSSPDLDKDADRLNITHVESGLSVVQYVPEAFLPRAIALLATLDWDISLGLLYKSNKHFNLIKRLCKMADKESSKRQEAKLAADLNGRVQPGSGARWGYRRDVITPKFLVEAKITDKSTYRVSLADFEALATQAAAASKTPVYMVGIKRYPDVAVMYDADLQCEFESKLTQLARIDVGCNNRATKSLSITEKMVAAINAAPNVYIVDVNGTEFAVLSYSAFLMLAKRGIDA